MAWKRHAALLLLACAALAQGAVELTSPGLPPSKVEDGALVEDWGALRLTLDGQPIAGPVEAVRLDGVVPGARFEAKVGGIDLLATAWRAPVWPAGVDVLTVKLTNPGETATVRLALDLPERAALGPGVVRVGGRQVIALPDRERILQQPRDWGCWDGSQAMPGWGKPAVECDPAFANIRAGMGGVPIVYRFRLSQAQVALGIMESHWDEVGRRPVIAAVEGAESQTVDPIAAWGRHQPGVLLYEGRDSNGDGWLDIAVTTPQSAGDRNPILNAIWLFPPGAATRAEDIAAGRLNALALRRVDVGGQGDQSLYPESGAAWDIKLPAGGSDELTFLVACPGANVPDPQQSAWTPTSLLRAARDVWAGQRR